MSWVHSGSLAKGCRGRCNMSGSRKSIARLLDRHKTVLGREMDPTNSQVLDHLVKKGVLSSDELQVLICERNYAARGEMFVDLFSRKGFNAFREFCITLELECPHLLTSLLLDSTGKTLIIKRMPNLQLKYTTCSIRALICA